MEGTPARPRWGDFTRIARAIVEEATGGKLTPPKKNATAAASGRKGGLKGGKARLTTMTPEQRSEAARKAAQARWKKK